MPGLLAELLTFCAVLLSGATLAPKSEPVKLSGTVVLLSESLKASGLVFDEAPIAKQVVLKSEAGVITPLLSDDASRALFDDDRLRHRKTEIVGRKYEGLPYVQVVSFRIVEEGKLRTPEYYCEICTISVRYPQICPCCQGEMVLRMRPERD
jgi:hypothetical protein